MDIDDSKIPKQVLKIWNKVHVTEHKELVQLLIAHLLSYVKLYVC